MTISVYLGPTARHFELAATFQEGGDRRAVVGHPDTKLAGPGG